MAFFFFVLNPLGSGVYRVFPLFEVFCCGVFCFAELTGATDRPGKRVFSCGLVAFLTPPEKAETFNERLFRRSAP